jgi:hypothetical protein
MSRNPQFYGEKGLNYVMPSNSSESPPSQEPEPASSASGLEQGPPPKVVTTDRGYTRTLHARLVSFRCEWCSEEREVWQYPGAAPRYCEGCREEAQRAMNTARQREKRKRDTSPYAWRPRVGRPRKPWNW